MTVQPWWILLPGMLVLVGFLSACGWILVMADRVTTVPPEAWVLVGQLGTLSGLFLGWCYASTKSSAEKTQALVDAARKP